MKQYTEKELRELLAAAFRECASIVLGSYSYANARKRMLQRAEEIENEGPLAPPPGGARK